MEVKQGRCLCGAVEFEYQGPETWCYHCHCGSCRRNTGSPFTTFVSVPVDAYQYLGTEPAVHISSPGVRRSFCATCGTPIAYQADSFPDIIDFYAATLDDPKSVDPEFHVHFAEKLDWIDLKDSLPRYEASAAPFLDASE